MYKVCDIYINEKRKGIIRKLGFGKNLTCLSYFTELGLERLWNFDSLSCARIPMWEGKVFKESNIMGTDWYELYNGEE